MPNWLDKIVYDATQLMYGSEAKLNMTPAERQQALRELFERAAKEVPLPE